MLNLPLPAEEPGDVLAQRRDLPPLRLPRRRQRDRLPADARRCSSRCPLSAALFAGFTVARERAAASPALGAAWGALVGPVWAITLALLNALLQDTLFGHAQGESVFGIVLVLGALVGALGGYLAPATARDALRRPQAA